MRDSSLLNLACGVGNKLLLLILTLWLSYYAFHGIYGEYGLISYFRLSGEQDLLQREATILATKRDDLIARAQKLGSGGVPIDPDFLEERAKEILGAAYHDELVILRRQN